MPVYESLIHNLQLYILLDSTWYNILIAVIKFLYTALCNNLSYCECWRHGAFFLSYSGFAGNREGKECLLMEDAVADR